MTLHWKTLDETLAAGRRLGALLQAGDVIALNGPLGAGKTAFVGGLAQGLGVAPSYRVTSPTFVHAQIYPGRVPLHHLDLYRIDGEEKLFAAGLDELVGGEGVAAIEWYDLYPKVWGGDCLRIQMNFDPAGDREVELEPTGERYRRLMRDWEKQG